MIGGIVVMAVMTFGLSRLLFLVLPKTLDRRAQALWANLGALAAIAAIYVAIVVSENDTNFMLVILGFLFAVPFQGFWYWRDVSKLPLDTTYSAVPTTSPVAASSPRMRSTQGITDREERWQALVRYDADVAAAADKLRPFGENWVEELCRSYFALREDKQYLPSIVGRLSEEASAARAASWAADFQRVFKGALSASSLDVLRAAEKAGYQLGVEGTAITLSNGSAKTFLYEEGDVQRFGRILATRSGSQPL
jgi:hypothetical protein